MSEPPAVHVTQIVEREGRTFSEPLTSPICDFCGHDSPAWDYDCHDFRIPEDIDLASAGGWAACTPCSKMIEMDDWDGVLARCVAGGSQFGGEEFAECC